jgi:hypothetical protein
MTSTRRRALSLALAACVGGCSMIRVRDTSQRVESVDAPLTERLELAPSIRGGDLVVAVTRVRQVQRIEKGVTTSSWVRLSPSGGDVALDMLVKLLLPGIAWIAMVGATYETQQEEHPGAWEFVGGPLGLLAVAVVPGATGWGERGRVAYTETQETVLDVTLRDAREPWSGRVVARAGARTAEAACTNGQATLPLTSLVLAALLDGQEPRLTVEADVARAPAPLDLAAALRIAEASLARAARAPCRALGFWALAAARARASGSLRLAELAGTRLQGVRVDATSARLLWEGVRGTLDDGADVDASFGAGGAVRLTLRSADPPPCAGEPLTLALDVENLGAARVSRVVVALRSPTAELDGVVAVVGALAPGERRTRRVTIDEARRLPPGVHTVEAQTLSATAVPASVEVTFAREPARLEEVELTPVQGGPLAGATCLRGIVLEAATIGGEPTLPAALGALGPDFEVVRDRGALLLAGGALRVAGATDALVPDVHAFSRAAGGRIAVVRGVALGTLVRGEVRVHVELPGPGWRVHAADDGRVYAFDPARAPGALFALDLEQGRYALLVELPAAIRAVTTCGPRVFVVAGGQAFALAPGAPAALLLDEPGRTFEGVAFDPDVATLFVSDAEGVSYVAFGHALPLVRGVGGPLRCPAGGGALYALDAARRVVARISGLELLARRVR